MTYPRGHAYRRPLDHVARRVKRRSAQRSRLDPRWIFPALALTAPLAGAAASSLLQTCLMLGAVAGLVAAKPAGAFWSLLAWGGVTGGFGAMLAFLDAPNGQSLTLAVLAVAAVQALALLGGAGPAATAGWSARGRALLSLSGPLALTVLAVNATPDWRSLGAALAVALDLAALPLALEARRRARS
ncbi:hypothetical protein PMI01_02330 [Caulobacter sp. AP07]|uniref:hypothetical protein n=1 Tax=Caulobacter sp. AP07 TaxID=1144304 RepID=UPI000271E3A7|nr:hypothetical protein [Caulobacter sp. AP07]EJL33001.1 hypothetical protein PMI01_02330 [Caulobacter sp. AP07]